MADEGGTGKKSPGRKQVDWDSLEPHYRAGVISLAALGKEYGCSDAAIVKHAKNSGWTRNLQAKIQAKAEAKVSAAQVSAEVSARTKVREQQIVEANAEIVAQADLLNRQDVLTALEVSRSQLAEVALLCDPQFKEGLVWLGTVNDESYVTDTGREVKDKANELYRYIISLPGRVKMSKEIAASHAVYIPQQRRILKLDSEASQGQREVDDLLAKINASTD